MATFNIVLDKRAKLRNDKYNLAVRINKGNDVMFLNVAKVTEDQYDKVFRKKLLDEKSIQFRETCNNYVSKCERIFNELRPFDRKRLRALFYEKEDEISESLLLRDLFKDYFTNNKRIKELTRRHYRTSMNVFESFKPNATVFDVTPEFCREFEKSKIDSGCSPAAIASWFRSLRRIINYYSKVKKIIPRFYDYPFLEGGYQIKSFMPSKLVLSNDEIKSVVDFKDFETSEQEYARNVWLLLYRLNGINFCDLLRMKWADIKGNCLVFFRKKTELTTVKNVRHIRAPLIQGAIELIEKIGVKSSPFILGQLPEDFSEATLVNKSDKLRKVINKDLRFLTDKLNLSVPLTLETARDCYATCLLRSGVSIEKISEMLGHSSTLVTRHYLGGMNLDETFDTNKNLF